MQVQHIGHAEQPGQPGDLELAIRAAGAGQVDVHHIEPAHGPEPDHPQQETAQIERRQCDMAGAAGGAEAHVQAAAALPASDWDIEVLEMHHKHKVDAPSGTALLLGEAAAEGRGIDLASHSVRSRDGHTGARPTGTIGFATLRGGSVIGEHSVILAGEGELVTLSHSAGDRTIFARGALRAALWAPDKKPGHYSMLDVLGLSR